MADKPAWRGCCRTSKLAARGRCMMSRASSKEPERPGTGRVLVRLGARGDSTSSPEHKDAELSVNLVGLMQRLVACG